MSDNPYEAPATRVDDPIAVDVEAVRAAHLQREAALRFLGMLCAAFFLGEAIELAEILPRVVNQLHFFLEYPEFTARWLVLYVVPMLLAGAAAWGYLRLRPWVLYLAPVYWSVEAIKTPFAIPLAVFAAWLTLSDRGRRVLEYNHAAVRAQTGQLRAWHKPYEALAALILLLAGAAVYFGAAKH